MTHKNASYDTVAHALELLGGKERAALAISNAHPTRTISRWGVLRWQQSGKIPAWWQGAVDNALLTRHCAKTPTKKDSVMYQDYATKDLVAKREELADTVKAYANAINQIDADLVRRAGVSDQDIGTHNAEVDGFKVKVTVSKNISWDQEQLAWIRERIDGAAEFVDVKYSVSETKYNSWPEAWRGVFEPARTVKPSKPKVEVKS